MLTLERRLHCRHIIARMHYLSKLLLFNERLERSVVCSAETDAAEIKRWNNASKAFNRFVQYYIVQCFLKLSVADIIESDRIYCVARKVFSLQSWPVLKICINATLHYMFNIICFGFNCSDLTAMILFCFKKSHNFISTRWRDVISYYSTYYMIIT